MPHQRPRCRAPGYQGWAATLARDEEVVGDERPAGSCVPDTIDAFPDSSVRDPWHSFGIRTDGNTRSITWGAGDVTGWSITLPSMSVARSLFDKIWDAHVVARGRGRADAPLRRPAPRPRGDVAAGVRGAAARRAARPPARPHARDDGPQRPDRRPGPIEDPLARAQLEALRHELRGVRRPALRDRQRARGDRARDRPRARRSRSRG